MLTPVLPPVGASPPPLPPDQDVAAKLLSIAGDDFLIRETDHFTIAYDTQYEALRPLIGRLEGTYDAIWRFCEASGLKVESPSSRLAVLLFNQHQDFRIYLAGIGVRAGSLAGVYHQQNNVAAFCNVRNSPGLAPVTNKIERLQMQLKRLQGKQSGLPATRQRSDDLRRNLSNLQSQRDALVKRFNRFVLQHEIAHQMFFNLGVHIRGVDNPMWLVEGLACQFEVPQADSAQALRRINHLRLGDFREALGVSPGANSVSEEAYRAALSSRRLVPLVDLIADSNPLTQDDGNTAFRYAQAWALVLYLHRQHREAFTAYVRRLSARKPGEPVGCRREIGEFQAAFGEPNEVFQRAWISHMLKLRFDPRNVGR